MGQPVAAAAASRRLISRHHRGAPVKKEWPFRAPTDTVKVTEFGVGVPMRQEVEFADGNRIWLLRVEDAGVPDLFLRDLGAPALGVRIDLRRLVPDAHELPGTSTRDVAGWVLFALRGRFKTRDEFLQEAVAQGRPE